LHYNGNGARDQLIVEFMSQIKHI